MIRRQLAAILVGQRRMAQHRYIVADEDMVDRARVHPRDVEAGEGAERDIVRRAAGRASVAERALAGFTDRGLRSEEHRVGPESDSTSRSRWSPRPYTRLLH